MKFFKSFLVLAVFSFVTAAFSIAAVADDITDYINEALEYYQDGKYSDAVSSLNFAEQLIQQKKSSGLEAFLPEPLSGWNADVATSQAANSAMLGGGISAERQYNKGNSSLRIQIMADSPMLQGVMMMMSNPMFATSDGGKMERIGKQKAIVKFDPNNRQGELQVVVANRFMVTVEGSGITENDLKEYAGAIDYDKLAQLP
ncbi:MAG: hypothetical protein SCH71_08110 [Desulfobulbaceae bacterium]|nr:hypothetical protein [Desulfobulbaceae bacterium]